MNHFIDSWLTSGVWLLGGWSLRWGLCISLVAIWFAVRAPRHAANRDLIWRIVLLPGVILLAFGTGRFALLSPGAAERTIPTQASSDHQAQPVASTIDRSSWSKTVASSDHGEIQSNDARDRARRPYNRQTRFSHSSWPIQDGT